MNFIKLYLKKESSAAPLAVFRILFGLLMFGSTVRYIWNGWIETLLVNPEFHFKYYGFEWVEPLGLSGMYVVYAILILCTLFITIGFLYRISTFLFFVLFTYTELIDVTYYINHYYFISLMALLLVFLPANSRVALDNYFWKNTYKDKIPQWSVDVVKLQLCIVYFFAGIAKINYDWLINAEPLNTWLVSKSSIPLIGVLFKNGFAAYSFSWIGMLFDLSVPFLLWNKRTRGYAYVVVIIFHSLTKVFFPFIGMFPFVMMVCTLVFFSSNFHEKIVSFISNLFSIQHQLIAKASSLNPSFTYTFLVLFFLYQMVMPFRYLLYSGDLFWAEEGFRYSWRVMLTDKAGWAMFFVKDTQSGNTEEIDPANYLTEAQLRLLPHKPDMILQFAHFLKEEYENKGISTVEVMVKSYVSINGKRSQLFVDPNVNLVALKDDFSHKNWVLPLDNE